MMQYCQKNHFKFVSYLCKFLCQLHLVVVHQAIIDNHSQGLLGLEHLDAGSGPGVGDHEVRLRNVLELIKYQ